MASSWWLLPLVLGSCCCGYLYQGPPFRLGYQGLGEPLCWLAFGPLATAAALVGLGAPASASALGPGNGGPLDLALASQLGCGPALATTLVLFCSHFHQVDDDMAHGKRSPVQRLGTARAAALVPWFVALALVAEVMPVVWGAWPPTALLAVASLPVALPLIRLLGRHHHQPERISHSKFLALRFQMVNGVLFACGLALGRIHPAWLSDGGSLALVLAAFPPPALAARRHTTARPGLAGGAGNSPWPTGSRRGEPPA